MRATPLRDFQDGFARALRGRGDGTPGLDPQIAKLVAQPAFAVYRNTVMKGCIDALQANYPAVAGITGVAWFRAAAAEYVRDHLPSEPSLLHYGHTFAQFLATFEPARELPYLEPVARLDWLWAKAHGAEDAPPLAPGTLASLPPAQLGSIVLRAHPSARWAWFDDAAIVSSWRRHRTVASDHARIAPEPPARRGAGLLIVRPEDVVTALDIDQAACTFLDACARGQTLLEAGLATRAHAAEADLSQLLAQLLGAGAFAHTSANANPAIGG